MQPVNLDQNAEIDLENPRYYINRELSLLEFQASGIGRGRRRTQSASRAD